MMNIYLLSGLGADERALKYLTLPPGMQPVYLSWLEPGPNETLNEYAKRMAERINTKEAFVLAGLSFGGMVATEMLEFLQPQTTILISSVSRRKELPWYYRLAGRLRLNRLLPSSAANRPNFLTYWLFGINSRADKRLLGDILTHTNTRFSRWAVNALLNWQRKIPPTGIVRIHGTRDRVLPLARAAAAHRIDGGGHFMVVNRAAEVSQVLGKLLQQPRN